MIMFSLLDQLNVVAYDTRIPSVRKTVAVVINVRRNVNKPVFKPSSYSAEINETFPIGQEIVKVNATDKDAEVLVNCRNVHVFTSDHMVTLMKLLLQKFLTF